MNGAGTAGGRNSAMADGAWHSFAAARGNFAGNRGIASTSRGLSNFGSSRIGGSAFASSTLGRNGLFRGDGLGVGGFGFNRGFGFGRGFGGCWGCGLGFGWGLGWGWPFWDWGFGWGWPGYWGLGWDYPGYYPYWDGYYDGPYSDNSWIWDDNNASNYSDYTGYTNNDQSSLDSGPSNQAPDFNQYDFSQPSNSGASQRVSPETTVTAASDPEYLPTVVYMKDGTKYEITSYWSSGNTLHYVNGQGGVSTVDVNQIDLQRTIDENAKHGVRFWVRPQPAAAAPAPAAQAAPTI